MKIYLEKVQEDYTSKCTNIDYIELDEQRDKAIIDEISVFTCINYFQMLNFQIGGNIYHRFYLEKIQIKHLFIW